MDIVMSDNQRTHVVELKEKSYINRQIQNFKANFLGQRFLVIIMYCESEWL